MEPYRRPQKIHIIAWIFLLLLSLIIRQVISDKTLANYPMEFVAPEKGSSRILPKNDYALDHTSSDSDSNMTNCTPPAIDDFPRDVFSQTQRRQGFLVVHLLASVYLFYCFAHVCDVYFVPCIECICAELNVPVPKDVAGATFMAIAVSSPELFTNVIGTFITKGDLGVGAIVGSAVFNILGVCACCGIAAKSPLPLDWYPLTRDCVCYSIVVILLVIFLHDRNIFWYEALALLLAYALYIFVMYKNESLKRWAKKVVGSVGTWIESENSEKMPLLGSNRSVSGKSGNNHSKENFGTSQSNVSEVDEIQTSCSSRSSSTLPEDEDDWCLFQLPHKAGLFSCILWLLSWPARLACACTIPSCRNENLRKLYWVTFVMCMAWIGVLSYFVGWVMTVIGHTLSIPESVMGLTFIAAGASIPEIMSSIIVTRQGHGSMSISNSMGSNIFDALVCLGLPWLIRGFMIWSEPVNYVKIHSGGLGYSIMTLLLSVAVLYIVLASNSFYLDKKVGIVSLILYFCFITFSCLLEMNVFMEVNLPTCKTDY